MKTLSFCEVYFPTEIDRSVPHLFLFLMVRILLDECTGFL